jgi:hypothetical protein
VGCYEQRVLNADMFPLQAISKGSFCGHQVEPRTPTLNPSVEVNVVYVRRFGELPASIFYVFGTYSDILMSGYVQG